MSRNIRTQRTTSYIKIDGKTVDIYTAKIVYRCEECHSPLVYHNAGLACSKNKGHRGFIHRTEAARLDELQKQNINELSNFYEIKNGKVVLKNGD